MQANLFASPNNRKEGEIDPLRDARQEAIVDKWQANNGKGTLQAVTGFGKTRTAIKAAKRLIESPNAKIQRDVTVIVPSTQLYEDWLEHAEAVDFPMRVFTIQTLVNRFNSEFKLRTSLLIADEFHRYHSEVHGTLFDIVDYNFIFGTTATIDPADPKYSRIRGLAPIIDTVTLKEAREHNWVSAFTIFNLPVKMSPEERSTYYRIQKDHNKYFKTFDFDYGLAMDCLNKDKPEVRKEHARILGWDEAVVTIHAVQFSRTVQARKKFLYELPSKLNMAKDIINRFSDYIFITFSQSTDFADELGEAFEDEAVIYHSSLKTLIVDKNSKEVVAKSVEVNGKTAYKDKEGQIYNWKQIKKAYPKSHLIRKGSRTRRKEAIELLKQGKARIISTAKALDEGFNVPRIDASIVTSGYSKVRQSIQRLGRMIRQVEGKHAFQVELFVEGTQDETWLRKRQEESINIVKVNTIDEIELNLK